MVPATRYAKSGDLHIAYQVVGAGPLDLVFVPGWVSNVEMVWEEPSFARFLRRLASFSRVILFDKRGTGLSDRVTEERLPNLEQRMDDVRAVMDAAGSPRAALVANSEGGGMCMLFAATYPERTVALVLFGVFAKRLRTPDYPWAPTAKERAAWIRSIPGWWGTEGDIEDLAPSRAHDVAFKRWFASFMRRSASPSAATALATMNSEIDVRDVLPSIQVPTLVLHRTGDRDANVEEGKWIASRIPGARFVELAGTDHLVWTDDQETPLDEIQEFLTGVRPAHEADRVLATVLFTDIVGSTQRAAALGDRRWTELLEDFYVIVRRELERFRGRELDTAGDGFLATFDGPARAIGCALAIRDVAAELGLEVRSGLHTGEVERTGDTVAGIAVHLGARVGSLAGPGEVLVTRTVKDLVAGSQIEFEDRGVHTLKGVPDDWPLFLVLR